jgi:hypothetical protein
MALGNDLRREGNGIRILRLWKSGSGLCHNCDTKPAFAAKTDIIDDECLLILRKLLKIRDGTKIPAYRPVRQIFLRHQVLYAVPSNGEILSEFECTSTMPVAD